MHKHTCIDIYIDTRVCTIFVFILAGNGWQLIQSYKAQELWCHRRISEASTWAWLSGYKKTPSLETSFFFWRFQWHVSTQVYCHTIRIHLIALAGCQLFLPNTSVACIYHHMNCKREQQMVVRISQPCSVDAHSLDSVNMLFHQHVNDYIYVSSCTLFT